MATVTREQIRGMMDRDEDFVLVDTLPEKAYRESHLPGAIHIVSDDIREEAPRRMPDRDKPVVVYCANTACKRSEKAAARLEELGYSRVYDYVEGKQDWREAGLSLEWGADPEA